MLSCMRNWECFWISLRSLYCCIKLIWVSTTDFAADSFSVMWGEEAFELGPLLKAPLNLPVVFMDDFWPLKVVSIVAFKDSAAPVPRGIRLGEVDLLTGCEIC